MQDRVRHARVSLDVPALRRVCRRSGGEHVWQADARDGAHPRVHLIGHLGDDDVRHATAFADGRTRDSCVAGRRADDRGELRLRQHGLQHARLPPVAQGH